MPEVIEIQNNTVNANWNPFVGEETNELLRSKGFANPDRTLNENGVRVLDEAYRIMQVCGNPNTPTNSETGIVIGYVQSGKTLSFTTLAALARDNDYQIIIIIAGTSTTLLNQSTERLKKDLRLESRFDRKWTLIQNPSEVEHKEIIQMTLEQWNDINYNRERCRTVLITVMKQKDHLLNLVEILQPLNLKFVPTLIIDDEGDQASLNTLARKAAKLGLNIDELSENDVSTIYRRILRLKNLFPHHTFLQYTATPQPNLFINIMDRLSPNFIKLLTPGKDYTGGLTFFRELPNLIIEIPLCDLPTDQTLQESPDSLLRALKMFYLGVAAGNIKTTQNFTHRNRSMLVHPSRLQGDHNTFYGWINTIKESWIRLLSGYENDEKKNLLDEFLLAYNDLQITVTDLPSFEEICNHNLIQAIKYTQIVKVNASAGKTPIIPWQDFYSWILVGGQSMDRGFTVEGLTVTYMPRNVGVGNVDTVLQRARFFGYKRNYIGYCRVFLDQVTIDFYNSIIEHEEDVREQLKDFNINNLHLDNWVRKVVLDGMLNLTRPNVLFDDLDRDQFGNEWFRINSPHDTEEFIDTNRKALFDFLKPISGLFKQDKGHASRTEDQKHLVARVPMKECLEHLLNKLKYTRESDSSTYSSLRGILKRYLGEHPDDDCLIYLMSANSLEDWKRRIRKLDRNDEIQQLFQGRNPRSGEVIYPGDSEIKNDNLLTIQIHLIDFRDTIYSSVPTLAIWIPEIMGKDIIRQK